MVDDKIIDDAIDKVTPSKEDIKKDLKAKTKEIQTIERTVKKDGKTIKTKVTGKKLKQPKDFINHPLAKAVNGTLDMLAHVEEGTAQNCEVGECIVLTLDYYNITPEHPIWYLAFSCSTFGLTVLAGQGFNLFGDKKKDEEKKEK